MGDARIDDPSLAGGRVTPSRSFGAGTAHGPAALAAAVLVGVLTIGALCAPLIAPQDPFDLASIDLNDSLRPPVWFDEGSSRFLLGADEQGRDVLSLLLFGLRSSLAIASASITLALLGGLVLGLSGAYFGAWVDRLIMRAGDIQLSFPAILIALLINGIARAVRPALFDDSLGSVLVMVLSIALANWVVFARAVRATAMVELRKDYIQAARLAGARTSSILLGHLAPNVLGVAIIIAAINFATAILTEATLSFLGLGMPVTTPSLGTMIEQGNDFLFSGEWWLILFPGMTLLMLCAALNILGDWARDMLDPRAR